MVYECEHSLFKAGDSLVNGIILLLCDYSLTCMESCMGLLSMLWVSLEFALVIAKE